jgi:hypothetical protein
MDIFKDPSIQPQINKGNFYNSMGQAKARDASAMGNSLLAKQPAPAPTPAPAPPMLPEAPTSSMVGPAPNPYTNSSTFLNAESQEDPSVTSSALASTGQAPPVEMYGGTQPPLTEQEAMLKINSQDPTEQAQVLTDPRYFSFIRPDNPATASIFKQTDSLKLMDGTDGGMLPISEDNGSVYQCPFTQTPCSRPSFFKRIGAFIKKALGIFDDNQALSVCQTENLKDPIARQVLQSTGDFDKEVDEQLAENGMGIAQGQIPSANKQNTSPAGSPALPGLDQSKPLKFGQFSTNPTLGEGSWV